MCVKGLRASADTASDEDDEYALKESEKIKKASDAELVTMCDDLIKDIEETKKGILERKKVRQEVSTGNWMMSTKKMRSFDRSVKWGKV